MRLSIIGFTIAIFALQACGEGVSSGGSVPIRKASLPSFSKESSAALGQDITKLFPTTVTTCAGAVDAVTEMLSVAPTGVAIRGWAWDDGVGRTYPRLIAANGLGVVTGFGATSLDRPDVQDSQPKVLTLRSGFEVYTTQTSGTVTVYGVNDESKSVCFIGSIKIDDFVRSDK